MIIISECNTETSENGTYFTNPMSLSSVCSLMIRPMSDQICQVQYFFCRDEKSGDKNTPRSALTLSPLHWSTLTRLAIAGPIICR